MNKNNSVHTKIKIRRRKQHEKKREVKGRKKSSNIENSRVDHTTCSDLKEGKNKEGHRVIKGKFNE